MGTNYYVITEKCPTCGHPADNIHIGKSSAGWPFLFRADEKRGLMTWAAWREFLAQPGTIICDEYGRLHTLEKLAALVEAKKADPATSQYEVSDPDGYRFSTSSEFS